MRRISDEELRAALEDAMPAMDGLKRVSSGDWSVDYDDDCASQFIGREDGCPVIAIMEPGWGSDRRMDAIEALCIAAPQLAVEVLQLREACAPLTMLPEAPKDDGLVLVPDEAVRRICAALSPVVAKGR